MRKCVGIMAATMIVIGFIFTLLFGSIAIMGDQQCSVALIVSFMLSLASLVLSLSSLTIVNKRNK